MAASSKKTMTAVMLSRYARAAAMVTVIIVGIKMDGTVAFTGSTAISRQIVRHGPVVVSKRTDHISDADEFPHILRLSSSDDEDEDCEPFFSKVERRLFSIRRASNSLRRKAAPVSLAFFTAMATARFNGNNAPSKIFRPPTAQASAPVTPIKKFKMPDQKKSALESIKHERTVAKMKEAMAHQIKCDEIESTQGIAARRDYEAQVEKDRQVKINEQAVKREELRYKLLDEGIDPFTDVEGERQLFLFDHDIDLRKIPNTPQQNEYTQLKRDRKGNMARLRENQRFMIKCIVEDLYAKGEDPLAYFEQNQEKTRQIWKMTEKQAETLAAKYRAQIDEFETLSGNPKVSRRTTAGIAGAMTSAVGNAKRTVQDGAQTTKEAIKAETAKAKAFAKEQKRAARAAAKETKAKSKAEARAAKEKARAQAARIKADAKNKSADIKRAVEKASDRASSKTENLEGAAKDKADSWMDAAKETYSNAADGMDSYVTVKDGAISSSTLPGSGVGKEMSKAVSKASSKSGKLLIVPAVTVVGVAAGGGYAFKVIKKRRNSAEDERQRQFKLIMGTNDEDEDYDDDDDEDNNKIDTPSSDTKAAISSPEVKKVASTVPAPATVTQPAEAPKKRRKGLASVFSKKGSTRETNLNNLIMSRGATAPEFASLLAKLLTFGAPGRFPAVKALPYSSMPMQEFDLETAKQMLLESRASHDLTDEASAEVFASVVNCMIIDITDIASSALKEKEEKKTVDALNVVMDFMDHAASLFDSVAEGVSITPVTYSGTLTKSKLEQMYGIYAASIMTSTEGTVTQDRVDTLQQVFSISDKKAEGLVQKSMMKGLMKMMKEGGGEGMEGLSEMMAAMGGGGGGGDPMGGVDGEISPEELKQSVTMMKELVESGSVSKEELKLVRKQFKEVYGTDIKDLIKAADDNDGANNNDELGEDGKELLNLFKTILKEEE